jgi:hypothetical protein
MRPRASAAYSAESQSNDWLTMKQTNDKEQRRLQKEILRGIFADYDPKRHDAFVVRYNRKQEEKDVEKYLESRGVK